MSELLESALSWYSFESGNRKCLLLLLSGRRCWEFELPADLLGIPLEKRSNSAPQDGGEQTQDGRPSAVGARLGGLSDLYEPYLLPMEMSGNV